MKRRALLSVHDKTGLVELGRGLCSLGFELVSTGGTAATLSAAGLPVTKVATVTGFPEILGGRVKTLHPHIHGGLLADLRLQEHCDQLAEHGITPFELVAVNLYAFEATLASGERDPAAILEQVDIGGPAMLRAAAKNHANVLVVVSPHDYPGVLEALHDATVDAPLRRRLARAAFRHTAAYDAAIATWFEDGDALPEVLLPRLDRVLVPRYGENPHQAAAVYAQRGGGGLLGGMAQLQGKELSWNNLLDADAARALASAFEEPVAVVVKHTNPCGVGCGGSLREAWDRALAADPVSAFGSIVAVNRALDAATAQGLAGLFVEVVIAPGFEPGAREILAPKTALRLVEAPLARAGSSSVDLRAIDGGVLAQQRDDTPDEPSRWQCPTTRQPTEQERRDLELAWRIVRHVKSNAIVIAGGQASIGIGAGQMSRLDSCRLAVAKAVTPIVGAVAASDAFFPFRDGLDVLAAAGVRAIVQPGGSKRDEEVVAAADEHGIAMLLTGRRHFRH